MERKPLAVYVHIPFCVRKCLYCDFLSFASGTPSMDGCSRSSDPSQKDETIKDNYVNSLLNEIEQIKEHYDISEYVITSIFIGGGTPSCIRQEHISSILCKLKEEMLFSGDCEITMEVNPGTVTREKLEYYYKSGVNRLSFGLQSVFDEELKSLGRIHDYATFLENFQLARETGFQNINVDLMSAIPGQTMETLTESVRSIMRLGADHISVYGLIVEEGTPFYRMYEEDRSIFPDEEEDRQMYWKTDRILTEAGYEHYEISNYAKHGSACRHNIVYWTRGEYLGLGLGAASLMQGKRYSNVRELAEYAKGHYVDQDSVCRLTQKECIEETMFLGLRMLKGISMDDFKTLYGADVDAFFPEVTERMIREGLVENRHDVIRLTQKGIDLSNYVMEQYIFPCEMK